MVLGRVVLGPVAGRVGPSRVSASPQLGELPAEQAEAGGDVGYPVRRGPMVGEGIPGFAAPQRVAEGLTEVPGHDALDRQSAAGDPLVVADDRGQQLEAGAHARSGEGAQLVLRLAGADVLEVEDRLEVAAV